MSTPYGVGHRADRVSVLTHDLQGDPLTDAALRVRIDQQREVGMGMDVDEPRRQGHTRQVDLLRPGGGDRSHLGDTITRNRNVQLQPGCARTVEHRGSAQHKVRLGHIARLRPGARIGRCRDCDTRPGPDPGPLPIIPASGEAESEGSGRSRCADQTTGLYEGATFQDESPSSSGP